MNNKGFAISGVIYSMIVLFLMLMLLILIMLSSRKVIIDKQKTDALNEINGTEEEVGLYKESILRKDLLYTKISIAIFYIFIILIFHQYTLLIFL